MPNQELYELRLPAGQGPFPLICLTPILGRLAFLEDLFFERQLAKFFRHQGFATALIGRPIFEFNPQQGLEQIQAYLEDSVRRNQKALDQLLERREIHRGAVGSFGISFGAVINCLWAGQDPRLKVHVFGLAGGNIPEIILTSRDPLMRDYLKAMINRRGTAHRNDLRADLKKAIHLDPLNVASSIPRENVFMFLALFDRVVRFRYGLALWRALGQPQTVFLPLGHYATLLATPFLDWMALQFFRKKLLRD